MARRGRGGIWSTRFGKLIIKSKQSIKCGLWFVVCGLVGWLVLGDVQVRVLDCKKSSRLCVKPKSTKYQGSSVQGRSLAVGQLWELASRLLCGRARSFFGLLPGYNILLFFSSSFLFLIVSSTGMIIS